MLCVKISDTLLGYGPREPKEPVRTNANHAYDGLILSAQIRNLLDLTKVQYRTAMACSHWLHDLPPRFSPNQEVAMTSYTSTLPFPLGRLNSHCGLLCPVADELLWVRVCRRKEGIYHHQSQHPRQTGFNSLYSYACRRSTLLEASHLG